MKHTFKVILTGILVLSSIIVSATSNPEKKSTMKTKRILFIVTSHDELGNTGKKTGLWIEEFAAPYYALTDQGVEVTIASPKGGQAPIDPKSSLPESSTPATKRFYEDKSTQDKLSHTEKLSKVSQEGYDAVFYPGGHGPMWDLSEDLQSAKLIESFYQQHKPIAFVCHAPAALKNVKDSHGQPLVKGKNVTGFANTEEEGVQLTHVVPFLLEDMLKNNGANYQKGADWEAFAVEDGLLITGQNPASSVLVAQMLMKQLNSKATAVK